jgi:hypothetical protein
LEIKRAAMRLPGMRSENGKLGLDVERALHELSRRLSAEEREAAKIHADSDLRAKIAVWAIDREERKEEYDRFAKYYVNRPALEEAMDYFWRQEKKRMVAAGIDPDNPPPHIDIIMPRPGTWEPNPVDEEDRKEEFRLVLEYCFYMPPAGRRFDRDDYRPILSDALLSLPSPMRSLPVFASDAQMALSTDSVAPPAGPAIPQDQSRRLYFRNRPGNETAPLYFLCALSNHETYMVVADLWKIEGAAERIQYEFRWFLQRAVSWRTPRRLGSCSTHGRHPVADANGFPPDLLPEPDALRNGGREENGEQMADASVRSSAGCNDERVGWCAVARRSRCSRGGDRAAVRRDGFRSGWFSVRDHDPLWKEPGGEPVGKIRRRSVCGAERAGDPDGGFLFADGLFRLKGGPATDAALSRFHFRCEVTY